MAETNTTTLYQSRLIEKSRSRKFHASLEKVTHSAFAKNPLCGDQIRLDLYCEGGEVVRLHHDTKGCLICLAAAELMAEQCIGKNKSRLEEDYKKFMDIMLTGQVPPDGELYSDFAALHQYKARIRCAELPWQALRKAMDTNDIIKGIG